MLFSAILEKKLLALTLISSFCDSPITYLDYALSDLARLSNHSTWYGILKYIDGRIITMFLERNNIKPTKYIKSSHKPCTFATFSCQSLNNLMWAFKFLVYLVQNNINNDQTNLNRLY